MIFEASTTDHRAHACPGCASAELWLRSPGKRAKYINHRSHTRIISLSKTLLLLARPYRRSPLHACAFVRAECAMHTLFDLIAHWPAACAGAVGLLCICKLVCLIRCARSHLLPAHWAVPNAALCRRYTRRGRLDFLALQGRRRTSALGAKADPSRRLRKQGGMDHRRESGSCTDNRSTRQIYKLLLPGVVRALREVDAAASGARRAAGDAAGVKWCPPDTFVPECRASAG